MMLTLTRFTLIMFTCMFMLTACDDRPADNPPAAAPPAPEHDQVPAQAPDDAPEDAEADHPLALDQDLADDPDALAQALPGITINREQRYVDLDAEVVLRDADWIELIVCSPRTREHESILTTPARPSHIHLALMLIDLEPGHSMVQRRVEQTFHIEPPRGQRVELFYVLEQDGDVQEIPANQWVYDEQNEDEMQGNVWLFTGSAIQFWEERDIYMADLNGTVASLVNFGDDVLARDTDLTNLTDEQQFNTYTERIPEVGTPLTLRIRPASYDND